MKEATKLKVNRVEAIITNNSNKDMWIGFGTAPVFGGAGTRIGKGNILIVDKTDEEIFGIWDIGVIGSAAVQHIF